MPDPDTAEILRLYEEYPYPNHGVVSSKIPMMLTSPLRALQHEKGRKRLRLLDAGCGTGENALGIARAFPDVEVTGIDLNRASLDCARDLSRRSKIPATFERYDLMKPFTELGEFDVVVSVGVMHHLSEPDIGLKNLRDVSAPGALFLGMLYGYYGKWEMFQTRDALSLLAGADSSRAERLECWRQTALSVDSGLLFYLERLISRRRQRFGPGPLPWRETAQHFLRRRGPARQARAADDFTHVQEVVHTWKEMAELLAETGWTVRGWPPRSGFPDSPEAMFRGTALEHMKRKSMLEQAEVYERLLRPINQYFLAVRDQ